jgi:translation elongation factor P/translation initiation factor 5A
VDRWASYGITQEVQYTLSGTIVLNSARLYGGRLITLEAKEDTCWFTDTERQNLFTLANEVGAAYEFIWDNVTVNVVFAHHESPAVELEPLVPHANLYVGKVKLLTIEDVRVS